jgi:hypothetical protein
MYRAQHRGQLFDVRIAAAGKERGNREVLWSVEQPGPRRVSVPAGTAGFLVVGIHRSGIVTVQHEANVWLVDPHSKSTGRHYHPQLAS